MDDLFFNRVLFEWLRNRSCWAVAESEDQRKNRRMQKPHLKKNTDCVVNLLIFKRLVPVLSLRVLATSSRGLKKDYP